jgi:hypothetical protein
MLDLACHAWCRPLATVTGALLRPVVFLDRHVPAVRRHGYLLATVVVKGGTRGPVTPASRYRFGVPDGTARAACLSSTAARWRPAAGTANPFPVMICLAVTLTSQSAREARYDLLMGTRTSTSPSSRSDSGAPAGKRIS